MDENDAVRALRGHPPGVAYGDPADASDVRAIWGALVDATCPGWRPIEGSGAGPCPRWIAGGGCCGAAAREAVADWKWRNGNG